MQKSLIIFYLFIVFSLNSLALDYSDENRDLLVIKDQRLNDVVARVALFSNKDFVGYCTGTFIKKDIVLTARHCVEGSDARFIIARAGVQKEIIPVARIATKDMPKRLNNVFDSDESLLEKYVYNLEETVGNDIVLLYLEKEVSFAPAKLLFQSHYKFNDFTKQPLFTVGYPERASSLVDNDGIPLNVGNIGNCFSLNEVNFDNDLVIKTDCVTSTGNSGGPIFTRINNELYLVATHSSSLRDKAINKATAENLQGTNKNKSIHVNISNLEIIKWLQNYID